MNARKELFDTLLAKLSSPLGDYASASAAFATDAVLAAGYTKPRVISTIWELDGLRTGTVVRSKHGDIGSIDHGPNGNWPKPRVWMLDYAVRGFQYSDEFAIDNLPMTVLYESEEQS